MKLHFLFSIASLISGSVSLSQVWTKNTRIENDMFPHPAWHPSLVSEVVIMLILQRGRDEEPRNKFSIRKNTKNKDRN